MKIMKPMSSREVGKLLYKAPGTAAQGEASSRHTTAPRVALVPSGPPAPTAENACARWSGGQPPKQREAVPVVGCRDVTGRCLHWRGVGQPWSV